MYGGQSILLPSKFEVGHLGVTSGVVGMVTCIKKFMDQTTSAVSLWIKSPSSFLCGSIHSMQSYVPMNIH